MKEAANFVGKLGSEPTTKKIESVISSQETLSLSLIYLFEIHENARHVLSQS